MTYEMVVGLEVHVQLNTATKAFCPCSVNFGDPPNTNVCPVCLGLPGALPVLNKDAVRLAVRAALALGCDVQQTSIFARKNYFYPDLPKGYQISQYDRPLATGGTVEIVTSDAGPGTRPAGGQTPDSRRKVVHITRLHLEEDAGKSLHDRYQGATAVDLNRAGVPLVEIVSEPDMRSAAEAGAFLRSLKQILQYVNVSDVNMEEGSLRVDANVSARRLGDKALGRKAEVKNMNSFSAVERAIEVEFQRQCSILERGGRVEQQTMLWDAATHQVRPARSKEESHDYRYFPDPDLPPLVVEKTAISREREGLPELPAERRARFRLDYQLVDYDIEVLTASAPLSEYFEGVATQHGDAKVAANWVMGEVLAALKSTDHDIGEFPVRPRDLATLLNMVRDRIVTHTAAKQVFLTMVGAGGNPVDIAKRDGLLTVTDDDALTRWIDDVIAEHPAEAQRFAAGEKKLQGVLIGAVMKKSKGSADPKRVAQLLDARFGT
jgi:aspartyl-tRNA(Asn)/glutamyl-tRNA(Gln) amidotransferase subunit B